VLVLVLVLVLVHSELAWTLGTSGTSVGTLVEHLRCLLSPHPLASSSHIQYRHCPFLALASTRRYEHQYVTITSSNQRTKMISVQKL
jgi:hypothetical protein